MCESCGCGETDAVVRPLGALARDQAHEPGRAHSHAHTHTDGTRHNHPHGPDHDHDHDQAHDRRHHGQDHDHERAGAESVAVVELNARILARNDQAAARNRAWLTGREITAVNLMSAPGAGKTALLERTIGMLKGQRDLFVLEGDQATDHDGVRVMTAGAEAVQINTGRGCHLDAEMVARGLAELKPAPGSLLFIENVGNLVCPALFDLGEAWRVAILSVTEGDDKPLKYPHMFRAAGLMLLNKIDLLPHVDFDVERAIANARTVNPAIQAIAVSARTGEGMSDWLAAVEKVSDEARARAFP